jgi:hypothetical protein
MRILSRLGISAAVGVGAGVVAAIAAAVIELYLSGHGQGSITREIISWEPGGVHLSLADLAVLLMVVISAASTWGLLRHG